MLLIREIASDISVNRRNWRGILVLVPYRVAHSVTRLPRAVQWVFWPYIAFYKILTEVLLCTELHWKVTAGYGLRIYHGYGLVVHSSAKLGSNVILRHNVTIGEKNTDGDVAPAIGDDVDIGAGAILLGPIKVGNGAVVGAGSVVLIDVPDGGVAVGNPARLLKRET